MIAIKPPWGQFEGDRQYAWSEMAPGQHVVDRQWLSCHLPEPPSVPQTPRRLDMEVNGFLSWSWLLFCPRRIASTWSWIYPSKGDGADALSGITAENSCFSASCCATVPLVEAPGVRHGLHRSTCVRPGRGLSEPVLCQQTFSESSFFPVLLGEHDAPTTVRLRRN